MKGQKNRSPYKKASAGLSKSPVTNPLCGVQPHLGFSADMCGRKTPCERKPLDKAVFKDTRVVLAGVECSPKTRWVFGERHFRQESVDFFGTLTEALTKRLLLCFSR